MYVPSAIRRLAAATLSARTSGVAIAALSASRTSRLRAGDQRTDCGLSGLMALSSWVSP